MKMHLQTAHGRCSAGTDWQEPEFDAERVVWDADYRRGVMERLRAWRLRRRETVDDRSSDASEAA